MPDPVSEGAALTAGSEANQSVIARAATSARTFIVLSSVVLLARCSFCGAVLIDYLSCRLTSNPRSLEVKPRFCNLTRARILFPADKCFGLLLPGREVKCLLSDTAYSSHTSGQLGDALVGVELRGALLCVVHHVVSPASSSRVLKLLSAN
jgi:hypothetical protein